ncbi:MAG: metalloregulator ArsR/SmtB family transcription factor [Trueperaceae bacterium]
MTKLASRRFKDDLFDQFARIGKALASPKRLEMLEVLAQGERTVEALAREIQQSVANTSQHLQVLRSSRLVDVRRDGLFAYYRLAADDVFLLWQALRTVGEQRLAEVRELARAYFDGDGSLDTISGPELLERVASGDVVILDVRPDVEYAAGHLPQAVSIPIPELERRLSELPKDVPVVAYCRGPYCVMAHEAVGILRHSGRTALRLRDGLPDWRAAGRPVQGAARQ